MVSPSKHQYQQQQQLRRPSRENKAFSLRRTPDIRIRRGPQPLEGKSFYLDVKNHAVAARLEAQIRELGGAIELFLVRSVNLVASDRVDRAGHASFKRHGWACGGPLSLRSVQLPTPTPPTPLLSSECPSSNTSTLRGQTAQRSKSRVDAMLERALTQPQQCSVDPLNNAHSWGIPIWTTDKLQAWLDKIYESVKSTSNLKQINQRSSTKVRHLKRPYVKFDTIHRTTRPVFLELSSWPILNFDGDPGSCPFDAKKQEKRESKLINKEIKENKRDIESINKAEDREMTRRPRATAARTRRTDQLVAGYCEICRIHYDDLSKHVQSEQHLNFVGNDDNFLSLDTLINAGANVEAFLKLNRTKDIEKDCDLFPNGDGNLHNVVLPEAKVNKSTKTLNNFTVDEIKMVNGARRNLNLKLSSPHNLRARTKHESGHLLRSKGSPWHEVDKGEKFYDKLEGFTIKKRSKGTIWIEADEPVDEKYTEDILKEPKREDYKIRPLSNNVEFYNSKEDNINNKHSNLDPPKLQPVIVHRNAQNGVINSRRISEDPDYLDSKNKCNGDENADVLDCKEVDVVDNSYIVGGCKTDPFQRDGCALRAERVTIDARKFLSNDAREIVCNGHNNNSEQRDLKTSQGENARLHAKPRHPRVSRRGGRSIGRGRYRPRLSVEERLIEDNRAYYKVEVLGNKLRSSAVPSGNSQHAASRDGEDEEKKEAPSNEKPVVVRFKRVRKSELSLLSDEAESFMFGEPKRDDSSERTSDGEQSSVLPKDTDSEANENVESSASPNLSLNSSPIKQEIVEEDSQDSVHLGRARKRRRTQAEAFIKDNTDYYKFETPGSRLRYQAPLTGIKDTADEGKEHRATKRTAREPADCRLQADNVAEKLYPSKPSAEIEKMQFSFESVPMSEPWYQTYQRQDTGSEFWHCFSESDEMKPFLLPYEIENFHETLAKAQSRADGGRRRGRGRGAGCAGRSPRKSPRCHASTLAIMSTIIRKREQQSALSTIEESPAARSRTGTPRLERKPDLALDVDEEVKEIARTIDEMLSARGMAELDSLGPDPDPAQTDDPCEASLPKGAPPNLLELLDNCQDIGCLENNSSCASSECGEAGADLPLKRRKRRKNRTGWPVGNKIKRKVQACGRTPTERESSAEKRLYSDDGSAGGRASGAANGGSSEAADAAERLDVGRKSDDDASLESCASRESCRGTLAKGDGSAEATGNDSAGSACDGGTSEACPSTEDGPCGKGPSEVGRSSGNDSGNDENHEHRESPGKKEAAGENLAARPSPARKQRPRVEHADGCGPRDAGIENRNDLQLQRRREETGIVPRKHRGSSSELSPRRQLRGGNCGEESPDAAELSRHRRHGVTFAAARRGRMGPRRRVYSGKRRSGTAVARDDPSSPGRVGTVHGDGEDRKKDAYSSVASCDKKQPPGPGMRGGAKRKSDAVSSSDNIQEAPGPTADQAAALSERVSPSMMSSTELEQRRSSIEFQPVVRVMKLDDRDVDHGVLSTVTVASNRRLRSSGGSPRSDPKPPRKRVKSGRGHFGRWLKSS